MRPERPFLALALYLTAKWWRAWVLAGLVWVLIILAVVQACTAAPAKVATPPPCRVSLPNVIPQVRPSVILAPVAVVCPRAATITADLTLTRAGVPVAGLNYAQATNNVSGTLRYRCRRGGSYVLWRSRLYLEAHYPAPMRPTIHVYRSAPAISWRCAP